MAEDRSVTWPFDCFSASTYKRTDRLNAPVGEFPEVWGCDGSIENSCRPLSGFRFICELAGNIDIIKNYAPLDPDSGAPYVYLADTAATDPTAGRLKFNNATLASATVLRISETDGTPTSVAAWLATWDDPTSSGVLGFIIMRKVSNPAHYAKWRISGAITDNGGWDSFNLVYDSGSGTFSNLDSVTVSFARPAWSGGVSINFARGIQIRVGDDRYVDGWVYRITDANGVSRVFLKWRKPGAVAYESDRPVKLNPTTGGVGTDPRTDGLSPMDVVVAGQFVYVLIRGSKPLMFYFDDPAAEASNLIVIEKTGPGPEPILTQASIPIASEDTNGASSTYARSGTNSYANNTGSADPGENFLNLTEPVQNEIQQVTISPGASGLFTLSYQGEETAPVNAAGTAAAVQTVLEGLVAFAPGDIAVTKLTAPARFRVEFKGTYANTNVDLLVGNGAWLVGGSEPRVRVTTIQQPHSGKARLYSFSFFDSANTPPANVTNELAGPEAFESSGPGFYSAATAPSLEDPVFEEFSSQRKLAGPTLNETPDAATDSRYVSGMSPVDANRRYGFLIQFWDQHRTGRFSKVSNICETTAAGTGEEPYRAPAFEVKQISGTESPGTTTASATYLVAAGFRCSFTGIEVIYDDTRFDTLLLYRTIADNPKGPLSLDGIFELVDTKTTNQRKAASTNLPAPWVRSFAFNDTDEAQIAQQPSFDSASFLMDDYMPTAGSGIYHEGMLLVGNIGAINKETFGMGHVRWSSTTRQALESFSPLSTYPLRFAGEQISRFIHNGPNVLAFSQQNIYLFRKESIYVRGYHVAGGLGIMNQFGVCEVGSTSYFLTPSGVYTITQNGGISAVRSVQSLVQDDWGASKEEVQLAFDQAGKFVVLHNPVRAESAFLWLETSRITLFRDANFDICTDGFCPENAQVANGVTERACFFQQVEPSDNTFRWRVFILDARRQKVFRFTDHVDDGLPQLTALHPTGADGRQVVYADFTAYSTSLKVAAAGIDVATAARLEGCHVYVAKAADPNLIGRKAVIQQVSLGTDGGLSHTFTLDITEAAGLFGLQEGDDLFLSPVYCLVVGWAAGLVGEDGTTPSGSLRDKTRQRLISSIQPVFAGVGGVTTLTTPANDSANGYSNLARFAGLVFENNATSPSARSYPTETDETERRSLVDGAAVVPAGIERPNGFAGANLFPAVEVFVPNMDWQLLSFLVDGRILATNRPARALTGGAE